MRKEEVVVFSRSSTAKKERDHFVESRIRWLEYQGERVALQENGQNDWHDVEYEGKMAKAPPCPERSMKTPLPQQRSSSTRERKKVSGFL